jgi:hypothetical protein
MAVLGTYIQIGLQLATLSCPKRQIIPNRGVSAYQGGDRVHHQNDISMLFEVGLIL